MLRRNLTSVPQGNTLFEAIIRFKYEKELFLIVGIYSICFISCNKEIAYVNDKFADTIVINTKNVIEAIPISSLFKKVEFVPLETTDDCLIGEIDKLVIHNNKFFILDEMTSSLFIFSNKGEFIHKICQVGNGPNEYTELNNFFINKDNNNLILHGNSKLLFFDLDTYKQTKIENLSLNTQIAYFDDTFIHFLNNGIWNGNYNIVAKRNGQTVYQHLLISKENVGYTYSNDFPFSQPMQNNEVFFAEIFNNTIYLLNKDSMIVKYYIDFGRDALPKRFFESIPIEERSKRILNSGYCYFLSNYYRNEKLFRFNFTHGNKELSYYNFFDRREELIFNGFTDDYYLGVAPFRELFVDSTFIVSFHDVNEFINGIQYHNKILENLPEYEKDNSDEKKVFLKEFKDKHLIYYETLKTLSMKDDEDNYVISKWYFD